MGITRDIFDIINSNLDELSDGMAKNFDTPDRAKRSMSRSAADGTMQFPLIASRALSYEAIQRIANAAERNAASFAQIVLTMNPTMDTSEGDIAEYVRQFHQNSDTEDDFRSELVDAINAKENCTVLYKVFRTDNKGLKILKEELTEHGADWRTGKLNDVVAAKFIKDNTFTVPLSESQRRELLQSKLKAVKEAKAKPGNTVVNNRNNNYNPTHIDVNPNIDARHTSNNTINVSTGNGQKSHMPEGGRENIVQNNILRDNDVKKANELVPTLLHIRVIATDKSGKTHIDKYVDFIVGVKCTIHPVDTEEVIDELVDVCRNHDGFFKFIRWTTGEISFLTDFLLNMKDSKKEVSKQSSGASPWWSRLRHLSSIGHLKKNMFMKKRILPNASIVVTQEEVDLIKNTYGFDLMNPGFVSKIMDRFYLLCFIVADDALEVAHFKYDGQMSYQTVSYAGLEKENSNSARQFKDILRAVQRI